MDILKLNPISEKAQPILDGYNLVDKSADPVAALVRSFVMHEWTIPSSLIAVARAGAGVNNIPFEDYAKKGICVFNTPGANANAVKELVLAAMFIAARNINYGIGWAQSLSGDDTAKQVEKGKGQFAGTEILGKTLCLLGLGAIGAKVAVSANALGMKVVGYDPYISETAKADIPFVTIFPTMAEAASEADFISLHMPMTAETKCVINTAFIAGMKDGAIVINAARGELVVTADIKKAITENKLRAYVTDFPDAETLGFKGIITIPHLGASTEEAEDNCAVMAAEQLKDYIENGNIVNSVNMPNLKVAASAKHRVSVIALEGTALPLAGTSATKKGISYTLIDSDNAVDVAALQAVSGVIKVRSIF